MFTLLFYLPLILLFATGGIYAERKLAAAMQGRLGPQEVGYRGLLQSLADLLKLLQKEAITPSKVDQLLFIVAPAWMLIVVISAYAVLPVTHTWHGAPTATGVVYLMALVSLEVIGIAVAGWASNNKYARLGALRAVLQFMAYEVPLSLSVLSVVLVSQTLNLATIAAQQDGQNLQHTYLLGIKTFEIAAGGVFAWNILCIPTLLPTYLVFFITSLAACHRAPFDLPEAESELIGGYHTEYSGIRWAWLMLTEYSILLLMSLLGVILFLGAGHTPFPNLPGLPVGTWTTGASGTWLAHGWAITWLLLKTFVIVVLKMNIRWAFPRLRLDQVIRLCWCYLTPMALLLLGLTLGWKLFLIT